MLFSVLWIANTVFSKSSIGSPPVIPVPVALIALPSSITSSKFEHRLSLANISGDSRLLSDKATVVATPVVFTRYKEY